MSLARQLNQKFDSIIYRFREKQYRHSPEWASHRHNKKIPETNWSVLHRVIADECRRRDIPFEELRIDADDFSQFARKFRISPFSLYALRSREKKVMEHYVAFKLLDLKPGNRYIDIASESSPFSGLARRKMGLEAYSQDLSYPKGLRGNRIGSSADNLPVSDNWIDGASLQCAFEHFQGDIDSNFIRELARVLKQGGRCVIVPLYVGQKALNIYDPLLYADWKDANADTDAEIIAELALGGHFERIYAPASLARILIPGLGLRYCVYYVTGKEDAFPEITAGAREQLSRIRYVLLIEKTGN